MIKDEKITINRVKKNEILKKYSFLSSLLIKIKYIIKKINLKIVILYLIGYIFYLFGLTHINGVDMRCFKWKGIQCYYSLAILTFISSVVISVSIFIIINMEYNKLHIFIIFINYIIIFLYDHEDGIQKHGIFNFIEFTLTTFLIYLLLGLLKYLYYSYRQKKIITLFLFFLLPSLIFTSFKIYKSYNFNCDNWIKGLNDSFIDNKSKKYPCSIKIPKNHSCYLSEIGPYFDFTSKYRPTCLDDNILKKEKKSILNNFKNLKFSEISENNHFAFPLTNTNDCDPYDYGSLCYKGKKDFESFIYDNAILMDLYNKNKNKYYPNVQKPEIEVVFKNEKGKLLINVHKNKTLIKEREKILLKAKNNILYKNVLVMFIDTLSRAHFFRKFPKTIIVFN